MHKSMYIMIASEVLLKTGPEQLSSKSLNKPPHQESNDINLAGIFPVIEFIMNVEISKKVSFERI